MAESYAFAPLEGVYVVGHAAMPSEPDPAAQAQAEADEIREQARAEGYAAGRAEALTGLEGPAGALSAALSELAEERRRQAGALEAEAVELALAVAEKVVAGTLAVEPDRVLDVVRGAFRALVDRERVVVLVSPEDLDLVRGAIGAIADTLGGIEHVDVQAERRVAPGGAMVRTTSGEIDATIATKLDRAREVLTGAVDAQAA